MHQNECMFVEKIFEYLDLKNFNFEVIVVNQKGEIKSTDLHNTFESKVSVINSDTIGLSTSRNIGIENSNGDVLVFLDDDIVLHSEFPDLFQNLVKSESSIVTGKIKQVNHIKPKKYKSSIFKHNQYSIIKVSAMECLYKREVFQKLRFNENFGLGTKYSSGEENILLKKALDLRLTVTYHPFFMVKHDYEWFDHRKKYVNKHQAISKGILFIELYGKFQGSFLFILWSIRKCFTGVLPFNTLFSFIRTGLGIAIKSDHDK
jgi:glycosyltransferase involved in cell wall biosynthesis